MKKFKLLKSFFMASPIVMVPLVANSCSTNGGKTNNLDDGAASAIIKAFNNYKISINYTKSGAGKSTIIKTADYENTFNQVSKNPLSIFLNDTDASQKTAFEKWLNDNGNPTKKGDNTNYSYTLNENNPSLPTPALASLAFATGYLTQPEKAVNLMFYLPSFNVTDDSQGKVVGTPTITFTNYSALYATIFGMVGSLNTDVSDLSKTPADLAIIASGLQNSPTWVNKVITKIKADGTFSNSLIKGTVEIGKDQDILGSLSKTYTLSLNINLADGLAITLGGTNNSILEKA